MIARLVNHANFNQLGPTSNLYNGYQPGTDVTNFVTHRLHTTEHRLRPVCVTNIRLRGFFNAQREQKFAAFLFVYMSDRHGKPC